MTGCRVGIRFVDADAASCVETKSRWAALSWPLVSDLTRDRVGQAHLLAPDSPVVFVLFAGFHLAGEQVGGKNRLPGTLYRIGQVSRGNGFGD